MNRPANDEAGAAAGGTAVEDWARDYDIFDAGYARDPAPIWADLRRRCPMARSARWGGSWMPTRYADVVALAHLVPELSNREPLVVAPPTIRDDATGREITYGTHAPPLSLDPPEHAPARRMLLPAFTADAVAAHAPAIRTLAMRLIDGFIDRGGCDIAVDYAQPIPPRVIARILGIDPDQADSFVACVEGALGLHDPPTRLRNRQRLLDFFTATVAQRRRAPGDDLISTLVAAAPGGRPLDDDDIAGTCNLLLVAGIDTTRSALAAALWHLAGHADDRRRLVADPALIPTAVEELLRVYSPVTMGRVVTTPVAFAGVGFAPGERVLMNFPAANHDPAVFPDADRVVIDRVQNRHLAFGVGIHRCLGSNLARLELTTALSALLTRIPEFRLDPAGEVSWTGGQVRGPRRVPIVF